MASLRKRARAGDKVAIAALAALAVAKAERAPKPDRNQKKKPNKFYLSWEWKRARYDALAHYGRRCACCGWEPGDAGPGYLVVDHVQPIRRRPDLALDLSNLQVLCNDCNMGKGSRFADDFRSADQWLASIARDG